MTAGWRSVRRRGSGAIKLDGGFPLPDRESEPVTHARGTTFNSSSHRQGIRQFGQDEEFPCPNATRVGPSDNDSVGIAALCANPTESLTLCELRVTYWQVHGLQPRALYVLYMIKSCAQAGALLAVRPYFPPPLLNHVLRSNW